MLTGDSTCGQRAIYLLGMTGIPIYNVSNKATHMHAYISPPSFLSFSLSLLTGEQCLLNRVICSTVGQTAGGGRNSQLRDGSGL